MNISRPLAAIEKVQEGKKSSEGGGAFFCRRLWLPSLSQIFVWKVLDNPLFVYLLFSFLSIGFFYWNVLTNTYFSLFSPIHIYMLYLYFILVFKVLANPLFLLLTFSVVTGRTAMRAFGMLVPAFGESLGLDKETSTYLLTIMAVADFISRRRTSWVPSWYYWSGFSPLWQLRSWSREWGKNGFLLFSLLAWLLLLGSLVNEYFCWVKRQTLNLLNVLHEQYFNFTWKNT